MSDRMSLPPEDWSEPERHLWQQALQPARLLQRRGPASTWSQKRQRIVAQSLGQWFAWLARNGLLLPGQQPAERLTEERVMGFTGELLERVSPWSVAVMLGGVKRGCDVLAPAQDRAWLAHICTGLKANAKSSRDRLAHMVAPGQIMDLGLDLMEEARQRDDDRTHFASCLARDGLMLAMLISFPVRIGNFASIRIGEHLVFHNDRYSLRFPEEETKTGREQNGELPASLSPWIDWYLDVHRRRLLAKASGPATSALWINRFGEQLGENGIRTQIETRTRKAFGLPVWPHLFRAIGATGIVDVAPADISIASELLGHASIQTTSHHYILARGTKAHRAVQSSVLDARAAALERLRSR